MLFLEAFRALNAVSRRRVRMLAVKLLIAALFTLVLVVSRNYPLFQSMAMLCGWQSLFTAAIALLQRQRLDAAALTGWDESAALLGVASLMRFLSVVTG